MTKQELLQAIAQLNMVELKDLVHSLKNQYGIDLAMVASSTPSVSKVSEAPVKTGYDVVLVNSGAAKLGVVKVVKEVTGLDLREAREIVDYTPSVVAENVSKDKADQIKKSLVDVGATVEIR